MKERTEKEGTGGEWKEWEDGRKWTVVEEASRREGMWRRWDSDKSVWETLHVIFFPVVKW